jgi:soluble lytic murein transglycosylase-like protein
VQRKRAGFGFAVVEPILCQVRQLGRGSNTFCVGVFALGLVNLVVVGPQASVQPPLAPSAQSLQSLQSLPSTAAESPKPAALVPAQTAAPTAPATTPTPTTVLPSPPIPTDKAAAPAPAPSAAASLKAFTAPAAASDEMERLRRAADLMIQVNTELGVPQSPYGQIIYDIAIRHSINPHLVAALIHVESAFNPRAVSRKGAYGLMQLLPETARRFGLNRKKDLFNPKKNLEAGVRYLEWLANRFGGDAEKILAAYNAGEGAVDRFGGVPPYQETQNYVQKIFGLLGFSTLPAPAPAAAQENAREALAAR